MGLINTEELLSPLSDATPSGPNLEYDAAFSALERSALGKPEQRMGSSVVPGEPPDWASVSEQCLSLLGRTRDLRIAVHLTIALLQRSGFVGFAEGLAVVHGMLSKLWDSVHPELDRDENNDPTMRITALSALVTPAVLTALRSTPIARARALGVITLRDVQALAAGAPAPEGSAGIDSATLEGVFQEVELEALEAVAQALQQSSELLIGVDSVFETHTGSRGPDLTPILGILRETSNVVAPRLAARRAAAGLQNAADQNGKSEGNGETMATRNEALSGEIRSREDVVRAIDKICAYYARFEPTSPLPLLLERCKRLVTSSFLDIIRDLAPDSVSQVERLSGKKPE